MNKNKRADFKYKRTILAFIGVLLFFLGLADIAILSSQQRHIVDEEHRHAERELHLMGIFARDALLRRDYATIEQFIEQWAEEHRGVAALQAIAPNGFVLAHFKDRIPAEHGFHIEHQVRYADKNLLTLKMVKDLSAIEESFATLNLRLILRSALLAVILGIALWYTLQKMALTPLEEEVRKRRQAEKKFRDLLEGAPDAMSLVNQEGKIVLVNARMENLFGFSRQELCDKDIGFLMPERFRGKHHKYIQDYFSARHAPPLGLSFEVHCLKKNGKEFPADLSLSLLDTEEGRFALIDIHDITERKRAEEKIQRNYFFETTISAVLKVSLEPISLDEQLERILDLILAVPWLTIQKKGCIFLVEEDHDVLIMKAQRGLDSEILKNCSQVPFGACLCGRAASAGKTVFADYLVENHERRFEGMLPHGQYCIPICSGNRVHGVISLVLKEGHVRNEQEEEFLSAIANTLAGIIGHQKTEQEKEKLQNQLIQSEKLSALGRMTASVAHEIRNPLTALGGLARRLNKKIPDGSKEKEYAKIIVSEAVRLEKILNSVLSFTKVVAPHKTKHDINEIIAESLKLFEIMHKKKAVDIDRAFGEVPLILIDKELIREVIDNLVTNAVDAMPDGGKIIITTGKEYLNGANYVTVKVADRGKGISAEKISHIFEPFFTTKTAAGPGKGIGLGLAISKKIMDEHDGFIKVESEAGKGAAFTLYFLC